MIEKIKKFISEKTFATICIILSLVMCVVVFKRISYHFDNDVSWNRVIYGNESVLDRYIKEGNEEKVIEENGEVEEDLKALEDELKNEENKTGKVK